MWKKPDRPVAIDPSQVTMGLYVWMDVSWDDHPFLYNRFKVSSEAQVQTLRALPIGGHLFYFPDKSTAEPAPVGESQAEPAPTAPGPEDPVAQEMERLNREKHERRQQQRDAAARADRAWEKAARVTREAMLGMARTPKQSGAQLLELSRQTASVIAKGEEVLLHLLGDKDGEGPQFHALNVMTLSMLLGKVAGLDEATLADLALGSLAHDIGKARVPVHILKSASRARHEEAFYREHGAYGVELARHSDAFNTAAQAIIADHHEYLDGTGWPKGKKEPGLPARIVALVNRYDRLCSPESQGVEALMPTEALARLYKAESARFDKRLLGTLIKLLGVYPPGTLVRLDDESLGLVISPGQESLRPTILIYSPECEKRDAPTVDLATAGHLKIEEALRPSSLPPDVLAWLNPRQRLSYFFTTRKAR